METISSQDAPQAVGPYSQAVKVDSLIFCSGQVPINPQSGELLTGCIKEQTHQVMHNLKNVLVAAGADFSHVVKATIFLKDMNHFSQVNEVYATYFQSDPPGRTTVEVASLPAGASIEITATAYIGR